MWSTSVLMGPLWETGKCRWTNSRAMCGAVTVCMVEMYPMRVGCSRQSHLCQTWLDTLSSGHSWVSCCRDCRCGWNSRSCFRESILCGRVFAERQRRGVVSDWVILDWETWLQCYIRTINDQIAEQVRSPILASLSLKRRIRAPSDGMQPSERVLERGKHG